MRIQKFVATKYILVVILFLLCQVSVVPVQKAFADIEQSGYVSSIEIINGGWGYASPSVSIVGGGGTGAQALAIISNGAIIAINIIQPGAGYTTAPAVVIKDYGGIGATATATLTFGVPPNTLAGNNGSVSP